MNPEISEVISFYIDCKKNDYGTILSRLQEDLQEFEKNGRENIEEYTESCSEGYGYAYGAEISYRFDKKNDFIGNTKNERRSEDRVHRKAPGYIGDKQLRSGDPGKSRINNVDEGSSPEEGASFSFEESRKNLSKDINDFFDSIDNASISNILFESGLSSAKAIESSFEYRDHTISDIIRDIIDDRVVKGEMLKQAKDLLDRIHNMEKIYFTYINRWGRV